MKKEHYIWIALRLGMGWMLFWAFLDKLFGLGFATSAEKAWIAGGSPTLGFLKGGTSGPFASIYQSIAGNPVVDWLFMMGLLLIGLSLILGICIKIAGYSGALLMLLIWGAHLPPDNNPFMDEHIIYIIVFLGFTQTKAGHWLGGGRWWKNTRLVKKYPTLE